MKITIVGIGRAGGSFALALGQVGHEVHLVHHDELDRLGHPDLIVLSVPDDALSTIAALVVPSEGYVVAHVAGSRSLSELGAHPRVGLMHPLAALPNPERGAERLLGATYSVAGDEVVYDVVASLRGRAIHLADGQRVGYHATASVAANHLVALLGQVQSLAEAVGLTLDDFLPLVRQALDDVEELGVQRALTGPASRADMATIDAHLGAMAPAQRSTYVAMANAAFDLAEARRVARRA